LWKILGERIYAFSRRGPRKSVAPKSLFTGLSVPPPFLLFFAPGKVYRVFTNRFPNLNFASATIVILTVRRERALNAPFFAALVELAGVQTTVTEKRYQQ